MPHKVGNGAILGIVSEDGAPAQKRITLMDRSDLSIIQRSASDIYGAYAFTGLNPDTDDYLIFTVDDDGVEKKSPLIYDYVKPIPAHQGGFYWANWFRVSTAKEPICSFMGNTSSTDPLDIEFTYGVGRYRAIAIGDTAFANKAPITPAAQSMATLGLKSLSVGRLALNHKNFMRQTGSAQVSAEWVFDPSTVISTALIVLVKAQQTYDNNTGQYDYTHPSPFIAISYDKTSNKISLLRNNGENGPQDGRPIDATTIAVEYTLPLDLGVSPIHVAGSINYGNSCELYVNGLLVGSANLGGTNTSVQHNEIRHNYIYGIVGSKTFSGKPSYSNPGTYDTSIFAFYSETMTAAEALDHYECLFVDKKPVVTGYLKSVVSDFPLYFFRLNDENDSAISIDALRPYNKDGNNSALTKCKPLSMTHQGGISIVTGGSGYYFNGGALLGTSQFSFPNSSRFASVEFIAQPSSSAISGYQVMISHRYGSSIMFEVRLTSAKKLNLVWLEGGTSTTTLLNTVVSSSAMSHYAISVNKELGYAYLFVNGVLVETVVITKIYMDNIKSKTKETETLHIGGVASNISTVSMGYVGYLSEVATYPYALTERIAKSHYDARLTI